MPTVINRYSGDTEPAVTGQLLDSDGTAVDLSGVTSPTLVAYIVDANTGAAATPPSIPITLDTPATGSYSWDTNATTGLGALAAGKYAAVIEVLGDAGAYRRTFPHGERIEIRIGSDFGDQ